MKPDNIKAMMKEMEDLKGEYEREIESLRKRIKQQEYELKNNYISEDEFKKELDLKNARYSELLKDSVRLGNEARLAKKYAKSLEQSMKDEFQKQLQYLQEKNEYLEKENSKLEYKLSVNMEALAKWQIKYTPFGGI